MTATSVTGAAMEATSATGAAMTATNVSGAISKYVSRPASEQRVREQVTRLSSERRGQRASGATSEQMARLPSEWRGQRAYGVVAERENRWCDRQANGADNNRMT